MKRGIRLPTGSHKMEVDYPKLSPDHKKRIETTLRAKLRECACRHKGISLTREEALFVWDFISHCGAENCMGQRVDGCATWVSKERLDQAEDKLRRIQENQNV